MDAFRNPLLTWVELKTSLAIILFKLHQLFGPSKLYLVIIIGGNIPPGPKTS